MTSLSETETEALVSIVIPTYNRATFLREAIESVRVQTFRQWELIVVDDGSTDDTPTIVSRIADRRIRLVTISHTGSPAKARNAGIAEARADFVAFLDSDDRWLPEKLQQQLPILTEDERARWSYTRFTMIDERGNEMAIPTGPAWRPYSGSILEQLVRIRAAVAISSVIAERSLLDEIGGFDEDPDIVLREDYDLFLRLSAVASVVAVPTTLCQIRDHVARSTRAVHDRFRRAATVYEKCERMTRNPRIRWLCRIQRASHLVGSAKFQIAERAPASARESLREALPLGLLYAGWWLVLLKSLVGALTSRR